MVISFEEALGKTDLFSRVDRKHLGKFAERVSPQHYADGQVITKEGDLGTGLYVITNGGAKVIVHRGQADEMVLAEFSAGDFFGDMALLLEQPRTATVVATAETDCLVLHRADFKRLAVENPELLWNMLEIVAERLLAADQELAKKI